MKAAWGIAGAVGAIAVSMSMVGAGVAAADPYAGQTYGDASSAISSYGQTAIIAGRVGSLLPDSECIVTRSQQAPWTSGANFVPVTDTVLLYLNCNQTLAGPGVPGNSAASPEGRQAKKDQEAYVWKSTTEEGAQWCAANQKAHPDWGAAAFNGCPGT